MKTTDRYALMLAGIQIALSLLIFGLGMDTNNTVQNTLMVATSIATIYLSHIHLRDFRNMENNGFLTIGEGLKKGFGLGFKSGSIMAAYYFIYYKFLNPGFMEKVRIMQEMQMEEQGLSQKEIEQAMHFANMFSSPWIFAIGSLIGSVFFIFILSLISSAILKNENPDASWK